MGVCFSTIFAKLMKRLLTNNLVTLLIELFIFNIYYSPQKIINIYSFIFIE